VLPKATYCASVWLPYQTTYQEKIQKVIKELTNDLGIQDKSDEDQFRVMKILSPEKMKQHRRLLLLFKIAKSFYPGKEELLQPFSIPDGPKTRAVTLLHNHPLPLKSSYAPNSRNIFFSHSFVEETVALWNGLRLSNSDLKSVGRFKNFLFKMFYQVSPVSA
jgi:hypothetical protein